MKTISETVMVATCKEHVVLSFDELVEILLQRSVVAHGYSRPDELTHNELVSLTQRCEDVARLVFNEARAS